MGWVGVVAAEFCREEQSSSEPSWEEGRKTRAWEDGRIDRTFGIEHSASKHDDYRVIIALRLAIRILRVIKLLHVK